jgi:hypothetical protein
MKSRRLLAIHTALALLPAAGFALEGTLPGIAWAGVLLGGAVLLPVPLIFVLGQFGVAALTPTGLLLIGVEAALAVLLISDLTDTLAFQVSMLAGGVTAVLLALIPILLAPATQWTILFYFTITLSTILYGIHRYELYTTAQLQR